MAIPFTCPHCGAAADVADEYAGWTGPCVHCGKLIAIPACPGADDASPFGPMDSRPKPKYRFSGFGWAFLFVAIIIGVDLLGILLALLLPAVQAGARRQGG